MQVVGEAACVTFKQLLLPVALQYCAGFEKCDFYWNINLLLLFILSDSLFVIQHVSNNKTVIFR
jgi:hypothetical protein